jgi:NAD(P)-dependent dehydrogenase (short-subunit alcohol dehydrogenase family)
VSRFKGKVCIVAGGARGIGGKTAEMYAAQGGCVVIGDTNEELGHELAGRIGEGRAVFQPLDVCDQASCRAVVERSVKEFGALDHLVNCAIRMSPGALAELSLESWNLVVDIGLTGTFLMCQAAGRWMLAQGRSGAMVNLSSNAGVQPYGMSGAYSTVKAGIIMLSQHFAIEWASKKIRVNAVCPGHTETPLTAYLQDPEIKRARSDVTPLKRVGQPEDIAHGILFLLSDEADYITATRLEIDGGLTKSVFNHMPGRKWD